MRRLAFRQFSVALLLLPLIAASVFGQRPPEHLADLLADRPSIAAPAERAAVVSRMSRLEQDRKAAAMARARNLGLPIRARGPGNQVVELMAFGDDGRPLYAITYNREAAITTAANTARAAFAVDGAGFAVGVWDAGAIRPTHEAFGGRVTIMDGSEIDSHSTHVGGTIGAAGPNSRAHGMSPAVHLDSYDWNSDKSEMTARGASYPREAGKIHLSNHSYGYRSGWSQTGTASPQWEWFGQGTTATAVEDNFGKYNTHARDMDSLAHSLPYYLTFWAAGNDRTDNPSQGASVRINGSLYSYQNASHPPGDGTYKSGYDTIGFESVAKNVVTVGSVSDAVTFSQRDLSKATLAASSAWGPTDDGRIKPDIVANGASLYSTTSSGDSSYSNSSGTSMASPNAAGSAQLLVSYFDQLFPGQAMRASTVKGLIIHTADDLGPPGPDYRFGWGLMNTEAAAAQIAAHRASPGSRHLLEAELTAENPVHAHPFSWNGTSPIRVTLSWTDPAAASTTSHDNRSSRLVNNLDLLLHGPDGSLHRPYVMPYVGDWSEAALSAPAVSGKNDTDNVEQVFVVNPPVAGQYTAVVTVDGALTSGSQIYSLLISGSQTEDAPPPEVTAVSPASIGDSPALLTIEGAGFQLGAKVHLAFPGEADREAFGHEVFPDKIRARVDTEGMAAGFWDLVVTNADGQQAILPGALAVPVPFWSEDFDGTIAGWSSAADPAGSAWTVSDLSSRSPTHAFRAPAPEITTIDDLYSPTIDISAEATDLTFSFWHAHDFLANDGGVIEFSLDGESWFDPTSAGSGASFIAGGYHAFLTGKGNVNLRNPLTSDSRAAWSGKQTEFSEVVIHLDASVYAGKSFRARWRLGANNQFGSPGWTIDDVALRGAGSAIPTPVITVAPLASESPVTGTAVDLFAEAENPGSDNALIYTWTANDSPEFPVSFSDNSSATAKSTVATFTRSGTYTFVLSVRNAFNASVRERFQLDVVATASDVAVTPSSAAVPVGGTIAFTAEVLDQFSQPLNHQPTPVWSVDPGAGEVTAAGIFTAANLSGGPYALTASYPNGVTGIAEINVRQRNFADWQETVFSPAELAAADISGPDADPDGDGLRNLLEYALGGHPLQENDRDRLPRIALETLPEGIHLVLTFSRPVDRTDLTYRVEASADMSDWFTIPEDRWQRVADDVAETVSIAEPVLVHDRRFLRLTVERN